MDRKTLLREKTDIRLRREIKITIPFFYVLLILLWVCSSAKAQRELILNTTGYGFDRTTANGIAPGPWEYIQKFNNLKYNGADASPTAIRFHIQWEQYEPTLGNYQREKLVKAVQTILALSPTMKIALHFPYMRQGYWNDSYISTDDIAQIQDGSYVRTNIAYTNPSMYSDLTKQRFLAFVDDVLAQIPAYYSRLLYVEMGNGSTEEYYMPQLTKNNVEYAGMYEPKAQTAWRQEFLSLRFPGQSQVTWGRYTYEKQTAPLPSNVDWNSEIGRDFHRFAAWGLLRFYKNFYNVVKSRSSSIKVLYFISDLGSWQGNVKHLHNSTIPVAMDLSDGVYSSDGSDQYDLWRKIAAIDILKGSDNSKIAAIEFDPTDLGQPSGGVGINEAYAVDWFARAFKHGAEYVHLAMHFQDVEIAQLAKAMATSKATYLKSSYVPPARSASVAVNIFPNVFTGNYLFQKWSDLAGANWTVSDTKPVSIKMTDYGYWENVWRASNYLPCTYTVSTSVSHSTVAPGTPVTLSANCEGKECDQTVYTWNGAGVLNTIAPTVNITAPSHEGVYNYSTSVYRSGCITKTRITTLNVNTSLPVTLIDFRGKVLENYVSLSWETSVETNSDNFEIQRSADGKNWSVIGNTPAAGDKKGISRYESKDYSPLPGSNLYRLKMVDKDGTFGFSKIINVSFGQESRFAVYPNPVVDKLAFSGKDWEKVSKFEISNTEGRLVMQAGKLTANEVNVQNLATGTYLVKVIYSDGSQESTKFIKAQ